MTSSILTTAAFDKVLDSFNFSIHEWNREYVLLYTPKDQGAGEIVENDDEKKFAFKKVARSSGGAGAGDPSSGLGLSSSSSTCSSSTCSLKGELGKGSVISGG